MLVVLAGLTPIPWGLRPFLAPTRSFASMVRRDLGSGVDGVCQTLLGLIGRLQSCPLSSSAPSQTMGTHNSYHVAPPSEVLELLRLPLIQTGLGSRGEAVPGSWEVTLAPLREQLQQYGERGLSCSLHVLRV